MRLCNFQIFSFTSSFNHAVYKNVTFGVIAITDSKPTALFRMDESSLSLFQANKVKAYFQFALIIKRWRFVDTIQYAIFHSVYYRIFK